jgi:hypothetical protein
MPQRIQHIDKIARDKNRDVLFIGFIALNNTETPAYRRADDNDPHIQWLEANKIPYAPCGLVADEWAVSEYEGHLYLDVPMDEANPTFQKLLAHFENDEGQPADPNCVLYYYALVDAMQNAHHDEPGFWEEWAKTF